MSTHRRIPAFVAAGAVAALAAVLLPGDAVAKGANLLPNSDFEQSAIEPVPQLEGKQPQPLLPTGWAFEGLAGLFDHSPHGGSGGSARAAAISIPAGGKRNVCANPPVGCHDNPATGPKNEVVVRAASVNPAWRNALPVPVTAGKKYELSVDVRWQLATEGEGVFGAVRWLYSGDTAPTVSRVFELRATRSSSLARPWGRLAGVVEAPRGATSAVVLLGATDDVFIGNFQFDRVFFGLE